MNKRQKLQIALLVLFAALFITWLFIPVPVYTRILGLTGNALGILAMVLSYRAEEKNKKK
ncbi:MAG: hypothetical protein J5769_01010 [Bacteroidales bacterium]|nr:hypothetical protein [Bacteroidales bacterium]